jgi:hypothetical protein
MKMPKHLDMRHHGQLQGSATLPSLPKSEQQRIDAIIGKLFKQVAKELEKARRELSRGVK